MNPSVKAQLVQYLPVIVPGLLLWSMVKWGKAKPWQLAVATLAGVVLAGTFLGPPVHNVLSQLSGGYL
jgi:Na+/melibiose symporter-like transporter